MFLESEIMLGDKGEVPEEEYTLAIGVADIKRPGSDVPLIWWSKMVKLCLNAAAELEQQHGIDAEEIDIRTLRPLDQKTIPQSIHKPHRCIIVIEDWGNCGMGAGRMERHYQKNFDELAGA